MSVHLFNQGPDLAVETLAPGNQVDQETSEVLAEIVGGALHTQAYSQGLCLVQTCDLAAELWDMPQALWVRLCTPGDLLIVEPGKALPEILASAAAAILDDMVPVLWRAHGRGLFPLTTRWLVALQCVRTCTSSLLRAVGKPQSAPRRARENELPVQELLEVVRYTALLRWAVNATLIPAKVGTAEPASKASDAATEAGS